MSTNRVAASGKTARTSKVTRVDKASQAAAAAQVAVAAKAAAATESFDAVACGADGCVVNARSERAARPTTSTSTVPAMSAAPAGQASTAARGAAADDVGNVDPVVPTVAAASGSLLAALGLFGLRSIEPAVVAALATDSPLLLIGAHGTAKSLMLARLAAALGLELRHYNASLLNFDDLVGFPLPSADGTLQYVRTPAAIWGAGAVFFDEISRCRPEVQNKLFSIVHERRVQGLALPELRHRWAAMNPPSLDDDDTGYAGSEPLDAALADRFPFVVEMPGWDGCSEQDQLAIIRADDTPPDSQAHAALREAVSRTQAVLDVLRPTHTEAAARYAQTVVALLGKAGLTLSPRRAGMICRSVLAVHAASQVLQPQASLSDAALLALQCSLPQRAQGLQIPAVKVLAAHKESMRAFTFADDDPLRAILCATDPLKRLRLAVAAPRLPRVDFSRVVADALAEIDPGAREAAVVHLFETGTVGRLNAAVAAQAGELYGEIATAPSFSLTLHAAHTRYRTWQRVKDLLSRLDPSQPRAHLHANALASLFKREVLATPQDAERAYEAFAEADRQLRAA